MSLIGFGRCPFNYLSIKPVTEERKMYKIKIEYVKRLYLMFDLERNNFCDFTSKCIQCRLSWLSYYIKITVNKLLRFC